MTNQTDSLLVSVNTIGAKAFAAGKRIVRLTDLPLRQFELINGSRLSARCKRRLFRDLSALRAARKYRYQRGQCEQDDDRCQRHAANNDDCEWLLDL